MPGTRAPRVTHRTVLVNGLPLHLAEAGEGPVVVLLHGFPELWFSWRHQLPALADAGYHAVAPDVRGYGRSAVPPHVAAYRMRTLVRDVTGLLDALGTPSAALVGHDWGAEIAWACAQLSPERFPALTALSVPYHPRPPLPWTAYLRRQVRDRFNWLLYFQQPGVADRELAADTARSLRLVMYALSGDAPDGLALRLLTQLPADSTLLDPIPEPDGPLSWLTGAEFTYYTEEFERTGFTGGLNRYRCVDHDWRDLPELGRTHVLQPTLMITGERETATRFGALDAMREHVPTMEDPLVLPGCGHWVQQERPTAVNEALTAFLWDAYPTPRPH
ncbi:alpha/beta fold hydrolase [Streptomyces sp. 4N509B]|uniref:alpha/beta fold hydrolase n=1 Tax=Streptomyces sp. 4N509B TaxID=3457413 RepID=UPI003FD1DF54